MFCAQTTSPIMEGGEIMRTFLARNPKQLDLCLKLLYSEKTPFSVRVVESTKKKIEYEIGVNVTGEHMTELEEKYRIMIS